MLIAEHSNKQFEWQEYSVSMIPPDFNCGLLKSLVTFYSFLGSHFFCRDTGPQISSKNQAACCLQTTRKTPQIESSARTWGDKRDMQEECTVLEAEVTAGMGGRQCCCDCHHLCHLNLKWVSRDGYRAAPRWLSKSWTLWIALEFGIRK